MKGKNLKVLKKCLLQLETNNLLTEEEEKHLKQIILSQFIGCREGEGLGFVPFP